MESSITTRRRRRPLSQEEVGALVGVNQSMIARMELGVRQPSLKVLARLRIVLRLTDAEVVSIVSGSITEAEAAELEARCADPATAPRVPRQAAA